MTLTVVGGLWMLSSSAADSRVLRVQMSMPEIGIADLKQADIIALVRATGEETVLWNNATNTPWTGGEGGHVPMIYRDQTVEVVKVIKGTLPGPTAIIRGVGGTIGAVTMEAEISTPLAAGAPHLVFLNHIDAPLEVGTEAALASTWHDYSVFTAGGGGRWVNAHNGITVTEEELAP